MVVVVVVVEVLVMVSMTDCFNTTDNVSVLVSVSVTDCVTSEDTVCVTGGRVSVIVSIDVVMKVSVKVKWHSR